MRVKNECEGASQGKAVGAGEPKVSTTESDGSQNCAGCRRLLWPPAGEWEGATGSSDHLQGQPSGLQQGATKHLASKAVIHGRGNHLKFCSGSTQPELRRPGLPGVSAQGSTSLS